MDYFVGKRVFITGGSSGIGLGAARKRIEAARARGEHSVYELSMDVSDNNDVQKKVEVTVGDQGWCQDERDNEPAESRRGVAQGHRERQVPYPCGRALEVVVPR